MERPNLQRGVDEKCVQARWRSCWIELRPFSLRSLPKAPVPWNSAAQIGKAVDKEPILVQSVVAPRSVIPLTSAKGAAAGVTRTDGVAVSMAASFRAARALT